MSTVKTVLSEKIGYITRNSVGVSDGRKQAGGEQTGRESGERRSKRGSCNCSCVSASISHVSAFKSKSSSLFLGRNLLPLVLSSPSMARLRNKQQSVHFCWTCMSLTRLLVFLFPLAVSQPPQESSGSRCLVELLRLNPFGPPADHRSLLSHCLLISQSKRVLVSRTLILSRAESGH